MLVMMGQRETANVKRESPIFGTHNQISYWATIPKQLPTFLFTFSFLIFHFSFPLSSTSTFNIEHSIFNILPGGYTLTYIFLLSIQYPINQHNNIYAMACNNDPTYGVA